VSPVPCSGPGDLALRHLSTSLSGLAFLWAAAATTYLLVASGNQGIATGSGLVGSDQALGRLGVPLVSANGVWIVCLLLIVTVIAGLPLGVALTDRARHRSVTWIACALLLGFSMISGFSVGLMYLPGAVALFASALTVQVRSQVRQPRPTAEG
jgi:hypothetical protein